MKKARGILLVLILVCIVTWLLRPNFGTSDNIENLARRTGLFGIISIGAAFVIITAGIDLSIGSVVGFSGALLPYFLVKYEMTAQMALPLVLVLSALIGLCHGLLITKVKLQPFVVTLCGLLIVRSVIRWITGDQNQGFGNDHDTLRQLATASIPFVGGNSIPMPFVIMAVIGITAAWFLNKTVYGRHLFALGSNEEAARYSGINIDALKLWAYVICSTLAGAAGILFALDGNSVQPSQQGNFYELYAIAAAVLGGCSLRGGEGSIFGVLVGAAVMRVLYNASNLLEIPNSLEFATIGTVILAGAISDEILHRFGNRRRTARAAAPEKKPVEKENAPVNKL